MNADITTRTAHRAVAKALWPHLKHDRWNRHRQTRDLADTGSHPPYRSLNTATIPNAPRANDLDVITDERFIRTTVWAEEWPGGTNLVIELTHQRYRDALDTLDSEIYFALLGAYELATCRTPFELCTNRHGTPVLRRNQTDPAITPEAALALEAIAAAADVRTVDQHDVDDALLTDEDVDLTRVEQATGVQKPDVLGCSVHL